ncbi:MAG: hypothetical protein J6C12_00090 [Lachnospiraceae bacterium]|nr:hypothetical protein [Lachnospiraceae bacterium]
MPAIYVESDVCPGDGSWYCNHFAGDFTPAGYNVRFHRIDQNPEIFPFSYERKLPVSIKKTKQGILYDFGTELFGFVNISGVDEKQKIKVRKNEKTRRLRRLILKVMNWTHWQSWESLTR